MDSDELFIVMLGLVLLFVGGVTTGYGLSNRTPVEQLTVVSNSPSKWLQCDGYSVSTDASAKTVHYAITCGQMPKGSIIQLWRDGGISIVPSSK